MERRNQIIEDNVRMLMQGIDLIGNISNEMYEHTTPPVLNSSVGGHFRHCIDFYNRFLASLESGEINYVERARNPLVEIDRALATLEIEAIIEKLRNLVPGDLQRPVRVIAEESSAPRDAMAWSHSSVMRELQALLSHTIHHYAIITLALRLQGVEPPAEFGVAPSTLAYWRQKA